MREKPEILGIETVTKSRLFHVEEVHLRFSNGKDVRFERLKGSRGGSVLVVPLLDSDTVLLIREYATAVDRYELSLPKGLIDLNEDPKTAANRELMEEVGYSARDVIHLKTMTLAPGYFSHRTHIMLARDLYPAKGEADEPEPPEVVPWSLGKLDELFAREDFTEARSIAALLWLKGIGFHPAGESG